MRFWKRYSLAAGVAVLVGVAYWVLEHPWPAEMLREPALTLVDRVFLQSEAEYRRECQKAEARLEAIKPRLMEDVRFAESTGLFPIPSTSAQAADNAGTLLNDALLWDGLEALGYE